MDRTMETIRQDIRRLFETDPQVHVNVTMRHPKVSVQNGPATIKGVYPNTFQLEATNCALTQRYSVQYNDVLIGRVEILEMMGDEYDSY